MDIFSLKMLTDRQYEKTYYSNNTIHECSYDCIKPNERLILIIIACCQKTAAEFDDAFKSGAYKEDERRLPFVRAILQEQKQATLSKIANESGYTKKRTLQILNELLQRGMVVCKDKEYKINHQNYPSKNVANYFKVHLPNKHTQCGGWGM